MATEGHPFHTNTVNRGIEQDKNPELTGSQQANGLYLDGHNTRPVSVDGATGSNEKIKGEVVLYPNNKGLTNYSCIGATNINSYFIEIWADNSGAGPVIFTVNGVIVLKSLLTGLSVDFPLQISKNESPENQELFFTDNHVPPYIFNIKHMVDALISDPTRYFSAFDPLLYQINLQSPLDRPVFIELVNVGGGGGLPVGQYTYQMRYVTDDGDRTNWSVETPMIPVVEGLSSDSRIYPYTKTYGGTPAPSSVTGFAPHLRLRVTNIYNYNYIEIRRNSYNQGAGINFVPIGHIVAKISIVNQQISVLDYIDPADSNTDTVISENDETQQLVEVETAKAIRYFDRRTVLMNVKVASKESDLEFLTINEKEGFPVIDKMYKAGHKEPWNHTYRRQYMGGEKYGFGVNLFDGVGTSGFVTKIPTLKNFQYPNRRDTIASETNDYSYFGTVKANTTNVNDVNQTHEVFDLADARWKSDVCDFKNIVRNGQLGLTGTRTKSKVTEDCDEDNAEIENHGAHVNLAGLEVSVSYQPFTPVRQSDSDVTGHEYAVTSRVYTNATSLGCVSNDDEQYTYRPPGFSPDYYAHGMMIAGVDNFPKWAKAFSVVRTDAAKRVVCQGLGFYSLTQAKFKAVGSEELGGKFQNKVWFYSPDIEQGIVSSDTLNDIIANPQNYKIQMVSPLGFFSEVYGFEDNAAACNRDRIVDMITYVRMVRDLTDDPNNQINPGEHDMGSAPGDGYSYPGYDVYRNNGQNPSIFTSSPEKGNKIFNLSTVKRVSEGRGDFIEIETQENFYGRANTGGATERHFADQGLRDFTEPMYMINIIRTGANVPDTDVQKYRATDHYQKLESIIGKGNGELNQIYPLVDERWEDCIPSPFSGQFGSSTDRFLYIKKTDGTVEKWINTTYMSAILRTTIESDITGTGSYLGTIKGVYQHENVNNQSRQFNIVFYHPTIYPKQNELIMVRYDNTAPIRFYGGDSYIAEALFSPIDRVADAKSDSAETQFALGIGFPYYKWKLNPRYYTIRKAGATFNVIQDNLRPTLGYIRQLVAMFCCEVRAGVHYAYNADYPQEFFPNTNYVIRPNRWDENKSIVDNGIFQDYVEDYSEVEKQRWKNGGFRFLQQINPDYACELPKKYFSRPQFGFVDKTKFITRVMWSLPRAINVQNSPGLRTFPANNSFDIDDNFGEIKYAYDDTTENGENLYAITNSGICMLLTKKSILSDLNSGQIAYMAADGFVRAQYWKNKEIGMTDELWRSAVEAYVPVGDQGGEIRTKALFFASKESIFRFVQNTITDIGREGYYKKINSFFLKNLTPGFTTKIASGYNKLYQEYYLYIKNENVDTCFVFGQKNNLWYGTNDFKFDKFTSKNNQIFGSKELKTYELNLGYKINNLPILSTITIAVASEQMWDKEFILTRVNSSDKPTEIYFYKDFNGAIVAVLSQGLQGSLYLKNYRGWEGQIPRILASVDVNRPRLQQRLLIYEIRHNLESGFKLIDASVQYKKIKGK